MIGLNMIGLGIGLEMVWFVAMILLIIQAIIDIIYILSDAVELLSLIKILNNHTKSILSNLPYQINQLNPINSIPNIIFPPNYHNLFQVSSGYLHIASKEDQ